MFSTYTGNSMKPRIQNQAEQILRHGTHARPEHAQQLSHHSLLIGTIIGRIRGYSDRNDCAFVVDDKMPFVTGVPSYSRRLAFSHYLEDMDAVNPGSVIDVSYSYLFWCSLVPHFKLVKADRTA